MSKQDDNSRETDNQVAGSSPTGHGMARVLGAILKSLVTVIIIVLLILQVVELGLIKVEFLAVEADDDGLTLTLEVHQSGPSALFFQQPVLQGKRGKTYELDPDSLEEARFALLDAVTQGQAEIELGFRPATGEKEDLTLVFNPDHPHAVS